MNPQPTAVRQKYPPPMAKYMGTNVNLKKIPEARSRNSNKWSCDNDKRKVCYVLGGSLACVLLIGAAFGLPIALTTVLSTTTTTETTVATTGSSNTSVTTATSTASTNTTIIAVINSTNTSTVSTSSTTINGTVPMTTITTTTTTTTTATTTTTSICGNMTCTFSPVAAPMTTTYGVEQLLFNCSHSLMDMTIELVVQRTVNATYANQYQTFWNLTTNQTYIETSSQIIYIWTLIPGQIIQDIGFPYFVEGQYHLPNVNQTTSLDTYTVTFTSICGDTIIQSGTF